MGQDLKVVLGYTVNLRPFWLGDPVSNKHTQITITKMKPPELKDATPG